MRPVFTVLIPLLVFSGEILAARIAGPGYKSWMYGEERGVLEFVQFLVLVGGFGLALTLLVRNRSIWSRGLRLWLGLAAVGTFYVAGEEISWGQHWLGFYTPELWQMLNDQGETNLHNTTSWLDQKPRLILEIGIIAGGILVPLLRRLKPGALPKRLAPLYPADHLVLIALLSVFVRLPERLQAVLPALSGFNPYVRASEVQELLFYYFVLLYLWGFRNLRPLPDSESAPPLRPRS